MSGQSNTLSVMSYDSLDQGAITYESTLAYRKFCRRVTRPSGLVMRADIILALAFIAVPVITGSLVMVTVAAAIGFGYLFVEGSLVTRTERKLQEFRSELNERITPAG